jgi:hypothetical protein
MTGRWMQVVTSEERRRRELRSFVRDLAAMAAMVAVLFVWIVRG